MAVIHVLDPHTSELIAAGEVVERPSSVAKELLENAVDAGATQITLTIERGGISLIEVSDNGSGIESEYIAKAFIRHATSKISCEKDLESIHTLGFRGEALASIASVARVQVLTCTEQDEFACMYRIEGGRELGLEAGARPIGTTITVRDLFYNTPARMKFLKKDASEGGFVGETVTRIALSHPEIAFTFVRDGKVQFRTPGDGRLQSAAYAVLGRGFAQGLLPVESQSGAYRVYGLITPPSACRASRGAQYFYLNGRFVKNRTMMAALENAYKGTLMQGKFPGCLLMLEMPPELVDVNVHPAKTEVRFARESDVFDTVYRGVKQTVSTPASGERQFHFENTPEKFNASEKEEPTNKSLSDEQMSGVKQNDITEKNELSTSEYKAESLPFAKTTDTKQLYTEPEKFAPLKTPQSAPSGQWENTFRSEPLPLRRGTVRGEDSLDIQPTEEEVNALPGVDKTQAFSEAFMPISEIKQDEPSFTGTASAAVPPMVRERKNDTRQLTMTEEEDELQYVGEIFKTYIVTQRGDELCLIDKHAAHERLIYETIAAQYGNVSSQMLLVPVQVNLSAEEKDALMTNKTLLEDAGLEIEDFGGSTVLLRAVPADVVVTDAENLVVELAAKLARGSRDALSEKTEWVLHSISCRAAVKAGDKSNAPQLMKLAQEVLSGKIPPFCPHGRPIVLKLTKKELEKQFGRLG